MLLSISINDVATTMFFFFHMHAEEKTKTKNPIDKTRVSNFIRQRTKEQQQQAAKWERTNYRKRKGTRPSERRHLIVPILFLFRYPFLGTTTTATTSQGSDAIFHANSFLVISPWLTQNQYYCTEHFPNDAIA